MVKAQDLRIGNWVEANSPAMIVREISKDNIGLYMPGSEADNFNFYPNEVNPIPITTKMLESLNPQFGYAGCAIVFKEGGFWVDHENMDSKYMGLCPVEHVHEMQNVFYALTYSELDIDPRLMINEPNDEVSDTTGDAQRTKS